MHAALKVSDSEARVALMIPEGWHIYGKEAGENGQPTTLEWRLPAGLNAGETRWPPLVDVETLGIKDRGYVGDIALVTPLLGSPQTPDAPIGATASWVVCSSSSCIPESVNLEATSPESRITNRESRTPNHEPRTTPFLLAFLGGLLLNIMPCVLPILALKALALAKKAAASRRAAAVQGMSYTAGVVTSFLAIAAIMLTLKAGGAAIGWGFQLQNPFVVGGLMLVMLAVAANLLGLFSLPALFGARATATDDDQPLGSFLTGALAVMVATPCTAPFMATAIGATLLMPTAQALLVFTALGLGMASPFLLISLWPAARRLLPKPGAWMQRFKHLLAIPMLLTALWLGYVLLAILAPASPSSHETDALHAPYSPARLAELQSAHRPVLVDATAAWCITCKVNERVALNPPAMQQFFREHQVQILVADWTTPDPAITAFLAEFGRNGVPLYVFYPADGGAPRVLPQVLTPEIVKGAVLGH